MHSISISIPGTARPVTPTMVCAGWSAPPVTSSIARVIVSYSVGLERVDRPPHDVVPPDASRAHRHLDVPHGSPGLLVEIVSPDRGEVRTEGELTGEVDDLRAGRDRDVAEAGSRMQLRRVHKLTMVHVRLLSVRDAGTRRR